MRLMSFSLTTPQILDRSKTVTRRTGWRFLKPGDLIQAVEQARGLAKGRQVRRLGVLRVVHVRVEPLARLCTDARYAEDELPREGFPCWSAAEFVEMFCRTHGLRTDLADVTRIEFAYVEPDVGPDRGAGRGAARRAGRRRRGPRRPG
jgi:hypothetical protein